VTAVSLSGADLRDESLLVVLAHPDDESLACGGLLAACAQAGARTALVCLTRGAGVPADAALAEVRVRELGDACAVLGVSEVTVLDYDDGYLPWVESPRLEADVAAAIARAQPTVVVTFDADGLYWHPDHIAVHERVRDAVTALGTAGPALVCVTMPPGRMRDLVRHVAGRATDGLPHDDVLGITAVDAFGAKAPRPTHALDAAPFAGHKLRALRCHATQASRGALALLRDEEAARFLGVEHYRVEAASGAPTFLDVLGRASGTVHTERAG
jgi:N-acetyl-1-D-myo-inositol-2-amino-2-deoxy-alpha-D-glucopyranoside deacetylase